MTFASFYSIYFMSLILKYKMHLSLETSFVGPDRDLVRPELLARSDRSRDRIRPFSHKNLYNFCKFFNHIGLIRL
jgi:hypothetical protein